MTQQDKLAVSALRVLSADAIQKAKSGHPGIALGAAPMLYALYAHQMKHNPDAPDWEDRDRFILSAGHGSALLYAALHLFGYGLTMEDMQQFRQLNSRTPGHPEYGHTRGVDATTGPLGQGVSMAVGMAIAQKHLAAVFNRPDYPIVQHRIYALCGDGCLMEGISGEAASLAGTLKLNNITVIYDCNNITIEGDTASAFTEDVGKRYEAYGWNVLTMADGDDLDKLNALIETSKSADAPTLIIVKTKIARYSPLEGNAKSHGEPLGEENIAALRKNLFWEDEPFHIPAQVYAHCEAQNARGKAAYAAWCEMLQRYAKAYPDLYKLYQQYHRNGLPEGLDANAFAQFDAPKATRAASGELLNRLSAVLPNLMGGSADLAPSNKSELKGISYFSSEDRLGRNIHFGVREHAMGAIANGMALHGGIRPFVATFFVFSDYLRHAVRMSALMRQSVWYIFTHDSIGVGEDGPTHQPIEHLASFRAMPNCNVWRPADGIETAAAYLSAMTFAGPTTLVLSRQDLPCYGADVHDCLKGGYILEDCMGEPDVVLIGTGSEVALCMEAARALREENRRVRVVSMPSMNVFEAQSEAYRQQVLPPAALRVSVEAGSTFGWHQYVGERGVAIGLDTFGASGPAKQVFEKFGFTAARIVETVKQALAQ